MKTFTKTLATLFAVSLAALALSSCKKVQPTELTVNSTTATVIKGSVVYLKTNSSGGSDTKYSDLVEGNVKVVTKIKTGNIVEDVKGNKIEETISSVQIVPIVDKVYEANLPIAAGEQYEVDVLCEFETSGSQKIGTSSSAKPGVVKYKAEKRFNVQYGQIFVANLTAAIDGFEATSSDGAGNNSAGEIKDKE